MFIGLGLPISRMGVTGGGQSPSAWLASFMAGQSDGFWYDFSRPTTLFQGTDESTPVDTFGQVIGRAKDQRTGANSPRNATQATTSLKPKYQTTGAAFDGSDDNLLTGYTAGAAENFIVAKVTVPATISGTQVIAGARTVAGARTNLYLGLWPATGGLLFGVGDAEVAPAGDLRGTVATIGISFNGAAVRAFVNGSIVSETARSGSVTTSVAYRLGAVNQEGSAAYYFGGSIKSIVAGRQLLDLDTFNKIAAAL